MQLQTAASAVKLQQINSQLAVHTSLGTIRCMIHSSFRLRNIKSGKQT